MNIKDAFPAIDGGAEVRAQVAARTSSRHRENLRNRRVRRTVLGGLATTGLVLGGVLVGPSAYAIYRLNRIAGSLDDCRTMIREDYMIDYEGKASLDGRFIYADGKWRIERTGRTQVFENGVLWSYDTRTNQVLKFTKPEGPFGYNASGMSVRAMLRDLTSWNWGAKPVLGTSTLDGKSMTTVTLDEERSRTVVYADPKSDMPVYFEYYHRDDAGLKLAGYARPKFDVKVSPKEFHWNFPSSAPIIDVAKVRADWAAKVEKPIAQLKFAKGAIAIRDYAVNERGHVFVIYSNGETSADRARYESAVRQRASMVESGFGVDFEAKDSLGNEYIRSTSSLQPYTGGFGGRPSEWIVLRNGEVLHGAWLYTAAVEPWRPRKIELEISHGDEKVPFELNLDRPTTKLIPEWFRALAIAPQDADDLLQEENRGRRTLYQQRSDYSKLVPLIHEEIERTQTFMREHHRQLSLADLYFQLYTAYKELGDLNKGRSYLLKASEESGEKTWSGAPMVNEEIIASAMKREGMR